MSLRSSERDRLLETVETQRLGCDLAGSPLYAEVLDVVADDLRRLGPFAGLLAPVATAPFGDAVLLRLLAGLHRLVLDGEAPELAAHYPSVGGRHRRRWLATDGADGSLASALHVAVGRHRARLAADLRSNVQTNEVGRSATLLGGFLEVGRGGLPLRVLEVGASAGLNLRFDRYRYVAAGRSWGPAQSPLQFGEPWFGAAPDLDARLDVSERLGCDVAPIDPLDPAGRTRLRSFIWADQLDRLARLDAALEVAATVPASVEAASAPDWARRQLERSAPGVATVLFHSILLQYLSVDERRDLVDAIEGAGARATTDAPVAWLRLEPGGDQADLRLTTWPGGGTLLLATSAYHGPPVVWRGRRA